MEITLPTPTSSLVSESPTLAKGVLLLERYEIIKLRALGGMSAVYEARDTRFSHTLRRCAIKEILNAAPDSKTQRLNLQSFEREANILASLNHPAIPHIFDYFSIGNRAYLVLQYIEGEDLEAFMERTPGLFPDARVINWVLQICDVLEYLHNRKEGPIAFRDMKPSNIMLTQNERVVLVDFGIAKIFADQKRGTMVGTEGYSPPEQYRGLAGPQGDIYALGATMHHLLTRQDPRLEPPFSFQERPPRALNPAISQELEAVVMKALEYEPEKRFGNIQELRQALYSAAGTGKTPQQGIGFLHKETSQAITPAWEFVCEDEVRSTPTIGGGVLYVGAYDNNLYALEAKSGRFLWKYPTEGGICSSPCLDADKVYFGSEDHLLYALTQRTGRIVWSCPTDDRIRSSPTFEYGHVFFGSDDGRLYAVSTDSGRIIWKFQAGGPIRCRPLLSGELIVFGCEDGQVYGVDMGTGEAKWKQRTSNGVVSSPCLGEGSIFIGSRDWHLYALNGRSGWPVWRFRTNNSVISSPVFAENRVFFGSVDGNIYALDARSGRVLWKHQTEGQVTSSPALFQGRVYIGSVDSHVYALDAKNGKLIWRFRTGGPVPSSPAVAEGLLYISSTDKHVYALPL
jgi:outer membrane protein assembly factor BamB